MLLAVWTFQIAFGLFILVDAYEAGDLGFTDLPEIKIGLTRFICGMIMHMQCNDELVNGLKMMKYSVNHYWKFSNYRLAFLSGLLQAIAMFLITLINYNVITISDNVLDIAKDFTALMIVGDFDNIFGNFAGGEELAKKVCNDKEFEGIFLVETTTSLDAIYD